MTQTDPRPSALPDDEINLLELVSALWTGKWWIAAATSVALAVGAVNVLKTRPIYQADGLLQLEVRSGALALPAGMQDLLGSSSYSGNSPGETEMEIMRSRMVMGQAVRDLGLQIFAYPRPLPVLGLIPARLRLPDPGLEALRPYQWGNETITVGELEVPQDWLGKEFTLRITGPGEFRLTLPDATELDGRVRERLAQAATGFSLIVDRLEGPAGREFLLGRMALTEAIAEVQGSFSVVESPRYSSILRVSYSDPDPRRAETILDAISRAYLDQNINRSAAEAQNSLAFIEEQLPLAERAVTEAQDALNTYRQKRQSVDVDYETRILLERATQIEAELNKLALQEDELKSRYTINHPAYQALLQNRAALLRQLEDIRKSTADLPETQRDIFNLTRNLEVAQEVYVQLLNRAQELRVVRASTVGSVRIIDSAYSDGIRIAPQTTRVMAVHLLAGMTLGVGIVFLRRMLRRGIKGAQELEQAGLPVFATVNYSPDAANHRRRKGELPILAVSKPDDLAIEALRSLRTSLHFGMLDARTNTVLFTSPAPEAGKTFATVNLATVAAQAGQKVCLIDADMRKGYLRRYVGKDKGTPGLAELLARETTLEEVLVPGPVEGLSVIVSGRYPPNPSELLMRSEFEALLATLNERFDLVIIDSPPTLAVTDPVVISRYVGATILVTRHLETMLGEVEAVRRTFETAGSRITGAILNGYKAAEGSKYGGQYHYYNYRYSYRSGKK
ncbi:polysaccharide biosynthesis tyrosine autokinase [Gemmobacter sp.]|uniref:polysaccharide biosynthesis tyrosine autokinase n=1 Tax=Gemmobacter sp. TaxID=1898957 RepID=UPI002AFED710|nr:polysaccharide biosynthesis tyrosine autokinase [Gemmobacter sp.]